LETRGFVAGFLQRIVKLRNGLPWLAAAVVLFLAWPGKSSLLYLGDSISYVGWPADYMLGDNVRLMGARPPVYPLFLRLVGYGDLLVHTQVFVSVASWCFLGWAVGRVVGLVVFGTLALTASVWLWNTMLLSESISLSLMAALIGMTIILARMWSRLRFLLWSTTALLFSLTRDPNIYLLPFLIVPIVRLGWHRVVPIAVVTLGISLVVLADSNFQDRWQWPLTAVVVGRIVPDPGARDYFEDAGMPSSLALEHASGRLLEASVFRDLQKGTPEFLEWIKSHGRTTYLSWLLPRSASYTEAWTHLPRAIGRVPPDFMTTSFWGEDRFPTHPPRLCLSCWMDPIAFPFALWWVLGILPLLEWVLRRELSVLSTLTASLVAGTYLQAFLGYHGDYTDLVRHAVPAIVLYWTTLWVGLAGLLEIVWKKISVME
jgi:hypothetical protein